MQFWRDSLDKIFTGSPSQQPVALALAYAIQEQELRDQQYRRSGSSHGTEMSPIWFKRIITEREQNLSDPQFMTLGQMETYCENTFGSLMYLQLESVGVKSLEADHAVSHLAKAIGIATMLRAFPFHMQQSRIIIPAEITAKVRTYTLMCWSEISLLPAEKTNVLLYTIVYYCSIICLKRLCSEAHLSPQLYKMRLWRWLRLHISI